MPAENDTDAIAVALRVGAAIESVGGSYFVGGSIASSLQGEPRSTNDIDIVVEMPLGRLRAFRCSRQLEQLAQDERCKQQHAPHPCRLATRDAIRTHDCRLSTDD